MIFDSIENIRMYSALFPAMAQAIGWIENTDMGELQVGEKYSIDGDSIYAKVEEYNTYHSYEKNYEGHIKYLDIQLVLSGAEVMEVKLKNGDEKEEMPYDENRDIYKVKTYESTKILVREGQFAVFFPQDLHKPCIGFSYRPEKVRKLVVKVRIDNIKQK